MPWMVARLTVRNIGSKHLQEVSMGRVKDWLIGMEEDALDMTREEWISNYGADLIKIYEDVNNAKPDKKRADGVSEKNS